MTTLLQRIGWGREKAQDNRAQSFARYEAEMTDMLDGSSDLVEYYNKYGYDEAMRTATQISTSYDQHLSRIGDQKTRDAIPLFCSKCQRPYTELRCPRCKG